MPASFRSSTGGGGQGTNGDSTDPIAELDQVLALVGVDQMTLPVRLLEILSTTNVPVETQIFPKEEASVCRDPNFTLNKETWDLYIPSDPCVMDKFEEGLRMFKKIPKRFDPSLWISGKSKRSATEVICKEIRWRYMYG